MDEYKVIEIVDDKTLIINYGFEHGAKIGDKLRISELGEEIKTESGQSLGTLDIIKDTVSVDTPYELFSICRKIKYLEIPILNPLSELVRKSKQIESLNVDQAAITNRQIPKAEPIKVGDKAMLLP